MREEQILFVDDDENLLASLNRQLGRDYKIVTAASAETALNLLRGDRLFAVVVSDMRMRGMDGAVLLGEFSRRAPETMRILLTGLADHSVAVRAINEGKAFAFLNKPVTIENLRAVLDDALAHWRIRVNEREFIDQAVGDIDLS
jgi:DNA-binding NtrC family response regulator